MTLNEIAQNLLNLVRGGRSNHDEHISMDQIKFNIKHYRAMFIRRDYARNGFISRHVEQDLGCVDLIAVDASKCCQINTTCPVFRTSQKIPKTVRYNFEEAISYVGDVSGTTSIPMVHANTIKYLSYDKYTNTKMKSYMLGDYLYVYNAKGVDMINVRGVFENPEDVAVFNKECYDNGPCFDAATTEYPIPMDMLNMINQGILAGELALLAGTFSDTETDRVQDPKTIRNIGSSNKQEQ
tara:strand:- start:128 stop:844 length:717 start_codon:yes stop_codon:yes gene_type:complete